jgi:polyisoprenoid-binding protein YceI
MLEFQQGKLTGGNFVMDMSSMTVTDLTGDNKQELETYLKKKSFFGTTEYPAATLLFNKVTQTSTGTYTVVADLKIKKTTKPISFELKVTGNTAKTKLTIDRSKFDVKDGSGGFFSALKDEFIKDDFEVEVNLVY